MSSDNTQHRRSRFCEDFDAPFIASIADPALASEAEADDSTNNNEAPTDNSEETNFLPALLRSARSSWSSWPSQSTASRTSSAGGTIKKWAQYPVKKVQEGAAKLSRSKDNGEAVHGRRTW